VDKIVDK